MADDATDFIRQVYSPEADDLLRRRLFLAGQCIGEATRVEEELRREIRAELLQMWRNGYSKQQEEALRVLSRWPDREVRDLLLMALKDMALKDKDEEAKVRADAAEALGHLGVADPETLQALREALRDEDTGVRAGAALALGRLGAADPQTLQALREALRDEEPMVRASAVWPLGRLGVADPQILQILREALRNEDIGVRAGAAEALGHLGVADPETLRALREALKDEGARVRDAAFSALWEISKRPGVWIERDT
jgi:HEAT repeat protein